MKVLQFYEISCPDKRVHYAYGYELLPVRPYYNLRILRHEPWQGGCNMNRKQPQNNQPAPPKLPVPLELDRTWLNQLESRLDKGGPWGDYRLFQLANQAEETNLIPNFDEIHCLKHLQGLTPLPINWILPARYSLKCQAGPFLPTR